MKFLKVTVLIVAIALLGSTFTLEAKSKKRRHTTKKEKTMSKKKKSTKAQQCALDMVEYEYGGMMMYPVSRVRVERENGKVVLFTQGTRTEEQKFVLNDGEQLLKEALAIIEEENMLDYGVSYDVPPEMQPLDGYAWWFKAQLADGRSVDSRGRNADPGGEGLSKMRKLLFDRAHKLLGLDY
ncbi:MAG: hypothetical protein IK100_02800 [Muribaculaceae bacterium]|nr:hypothetical protein [Muribaculaceae bacterium]